MCVFVTQKWTGLIKGQERVLNAVEIAKRGDKHLRQQRRAALLSDSPPFGRLCLSLDQLPLLTAPLSSELSHVSRAEAAATSHHHPQHLCLLLYSKCRKSPVPPHQPDPTCSDLPGFPVLVILFGL